jgi:hypothetical protein
MHDRSGRDDYVRRRVDPLSGVVDVSECADGADEDRLGERQGWRNLDEEMNVIVHSADGVNEYSVVLADTCDVCPHSGLEFV